MANHFKEYKAKIDKKKLATITEEEVKIYSKTNNNEGVSHSRQDWSIGKAITTNQDEDGDEYEEFPQNIEKEKTIERDNARKRKVQNSSDDIFGD